MQVRTYRHTTKHTRQSHFCAHWTGSLSCSRLGVSHGTSLSGPLRFPVKSVSLSPLQSCPCQHLNQFLVRKDEAETPQSSSTVEPSSPESAAAPPEHPEASSEFWFFRHSCTSMKPHKSHPTTECIVLSFASWLQTWLMQGEIVTSLVLLITRVCRHMCTDFVWLVASGLCFLAKHGMFLSVFHTFLGWNHLQLCEKHLPAQTPTGNKKTASGLGRADQPSGARVWNTFFGFRRPLRQSPPSTPKFVKGPLMERITDGQLSGHIFTVGEDLSSPGAAFGATPGDAAGVNGTMWTGEPWTDLEKIVFQQLQYGCK